MSWLEQWKLTRSNSLLTPNVVNIHFVYLEPSID